MSAAEFWDPKEDKWRWNIIRARIKGLISDADFAEFQYYLERCVDMKYEKTGQKPDHPGCLTKWEEPNARRETQEAIQPVVQEIEKRI